DMLPDHLKMRISITDHKGEEIISGREKEILSQNFPESNNPDEFETAKQKWERTGLTSWDFGDLPERIDLKVKNRGIWIGYPGLEIDFKTVKTVNLRLFQNSDKAVKSHMEGVAGLYRIYLAKDLKFLKKSLKLLKEAIPYADYFGGARFVEKKLVETVVKRLLQKNIRTEKAFYSNAERVKSVLLSEGRKLSDVVMPVIEAYSKTRSNIFNLERINSSNEEVRSFLGTLKEELARLVPENFIDLYDRRRLVHLVKYMRAIDIRAQRALVDFKKDRIKVKKINVFAQSLDEMLKGLSPRASTEKKEAVEEFFWLIEEYKVSIFAQELKTATPVSKKRIEEKRKEIERMV
ncbi:MAG: DUF3418 domain-containing protein, partial [Desulfobacterales bacterium]|nr:DUF3418 domain-containing protein [Deltaproteobacteria bacterium]NNL43107.1 DUF3418 domain-containing protein [Desulfobacterales bacterium]